MKISTFARHIREGGRSMIRNGWMTFSSVSAISISLFILGLFLLMAVNLYHLTDQVESKVEIKVFLDVNIAPEDTAKLRSEIEVIDGVAQVIFVSKEEGLEIMREQADEDSKQFLEGMDGENNPLNDAFTVIAKEPRQVEEIGSRISALNDAYATPPIVKVKYGKEVVDKLFWVTGVIRNVGLVLVICLGFTGMFLISNTIKLTIMARDREIRIMKLVGATNSFIRWPFFIEGALLGLIGSLVPAAILSYGYWKLVEVSRSSLSFITLDLKPFNEVFMPVSVILLAIGIGIGIWGSLLSVRKYLRV